MPQAVIDEALRIGANDPSSRLRIVAEFMKDKSTAENAAFLERHYGENGAGFYVGERKYALWYNDAGMRVSPGEGVNERLAAFVTWEQAAERIRQLLDAGEYAGQVTMYRAWPHKKKTGSGSFAISAQGHHYQTLTEAEKVAQKYLDGSMEDDCFQYEGAAVYDLLEKKWLRVFGNFPHEKAHEQIRQAIPFT